MYPKKSMHHYNNKIQKREKNTTQKLKGTSAGIELATLG